MDTVGIDAGNTRIKIGFFRDKKLVKVFNIPTKEISTFMLPSEFSGVSFMCAGIASVVPSVNDILKEKFSSYSKKVFFIKSSDCEILLNIKNPNKVGVDRVLNCKAALELFYDSVIVIDIGSAITIDYASKKKFMGGVIMPGPSLWISSLAKTEMIKNVEQTDVHIPGRDTDEAVYTGMRYGITGAINNVVEKYKRKYPSAKVILTGGWSERFSRDIKFDIKRRYLSLEGIGMVLYEKCKQQ